MPTALLLGGPADGRVFPLTEKHSHQIMVQDDYELGSIGDLLREANGPQIPARRHVYEQRNLGMDVHTRFTVFVHRGLG